MYFINSVKGRVHDMMHRSTLIMYDFIATIIDLELCQLSSTGRTFQLLMKFTDSWSLSKNWHNPNLLSVIEQKFSD